MMLGIRLCISLSLPLSLTSERRIKAFKLSNLHFGWKPHSPFQCLGTGSCNDCKILQCSVPSILRQKGESPILTHLWRQAKGVQLQSCHMSRMRFHQEMPFTNSDLKAAPRRPLPHPLQARAQDQASYWPYSKNVKSMKKPRTPTSVRACVGRGATWTLVSLRFCESQSSMHPQREMPLPLALPMSYLLGKS